MAKKQATFRLEEDMLELLKTWAFLTDKHQQEILAEAFQEYTQNRPEDLQRAKNVLEAAKGKS